MNVSSEKGAYTLTDRATLLAMSKARSLAPEIVTGSTGALATAAAAGVGVAVLPCLVGDTTPGLVRLGAPGELPTSEVWVLVHRDQRRTARVAAVRAEIERVLLTFRAALEGRAGAR